IECISSDKREGESETIFTSTLKTYEATITVTYYKCGEKGNYAKECLTEREASVHPERRLAQSASVELETNDLEEKISKMDISKKLNDEQQKEAKKMLKKEKDISAQTVEELGYTN
ncbi:10076_t:CDS:2, partial [Racocetra fulgida]